MFDAVDKAVLHRAFSNGVALDGLLAANQPAPCENTPPLLRPTVNAGQSPTDVSPRPDKIFSIAGLRAIFWDPVLEFAGADGSATYLWPRWLVLRAVGIVFLVVFAGVIVQAPTLVGPDGISPLGGFFELIRQTYANGLEAFWRVPSLLWLSHGIGAINTLAWGGFAAAVALTLNLWPRLSLFVCWVALLSFVTTWGVFTSTQVDQLMLETSLLLIPFAPAGRRPGLGADSPPSPLVLFMVRWLLFRVMLEDGLIKPVSGDAHWLDLTAMDLLYETTPFPTMLAYWDHHLPHWWHAGEALLTYVAEIAAPLLAVWGGRRGRWFALFTWTALQVGIQSTNNFGWLNTASIGLGLLLLDDQMIAALAGKLRLNRWALLPARLADLKPATAPWRRHLLAVALWTHWTLAGLLFAAVLRPAGEDTWVTRAVQPINDFISSWRSVNAYTLFAFQPARRFAVEFAGSNDGGRTWRAWDFHHQPQHEDSQGEFLAPWYDRFEATMQAQANIDAPTQLFAAVAAHLIARTPKVMALFRSDPFPEAPPTLIRIRGYSLSYTDPATRSKTGKIWHREETGDFRPMMYRNENGQILAALSETDTVRALAIHGNPEAQRILGLQYLNGEGVPKNQELALQWCHRAAAQGDAIAQYFMGISCLSGDGVTKSATEAAHWFRLAAAQGHVPSQFNLAVALAMGDGVRRDLEESLVWFGVAAATGDEQAGLNRDRLREQLGPSRAAAAQIRSEEIQAKISAP